MEWEQRRYEEEFFGGWPRGPGGGRGMPPYGGAPRDMVSLILGDRLVSALTLNNPHQRHATELSLFLFVFRMATIPSVRPNIL